MRRCGKGQTRADFQSKDPRQKDPHKRSTHGQMEAMAKRTISMPLVFMSSGSTPDQVAPAAAPATMIGHTDPRCDLPARFVRCALILTRFVIHRIGSQGHSAFN